MTIFTEEKTTHSQNGHTADANARQYIEALLAGTRPEKPDVGRYAGPIGYLDEEFDRNPGNVENVLRALIKSKKYPELAALFNGSAASEQSSFQVPEIETLGCPELPETAKLPSNMSLNASPCLDQYIAYSKRFSPEAYEHFHEMCFLWALSTVAARRVKIPLGDDGYTPLMLLMCAETSLVKKTTTAKAAMKLLNASGLGWFLGSKKTTPQKLVYDMAGVVPKNFGELDPDQQKWVEKKLAFSGQRGWYSDEFGKFVKSTTNANSPMADLQSLLLKMDSCEPIYDNSTIQRGTEIIENPYLAVLGSMTPSNISKYAKRGSEFWTDGFWARFAFVCAPKGAGEDHPFEMGEWPVPGYLIGRMQEWHFRLGVPEAHVDPVLDEKNKDTGRFTSRRDELPQNVCTFGEGVYEAWKRYRSTLKSIIRSWNTTDLNGNYDRLPTKAIRVAALLASLENNGRIEMCHWSKAQEITERWRESLHELYAQINTAVEPTKAVTLEDEVLRHISRLEIASVADLRNRMKQYSVSDLQDACDSWAKAGVLEVEKTSHTKRYKFYGATTTEATNQS